MALEITSTPVEQAGCIYHLSGRLDAAEAPAAYDRMVAELGGRNLVVLDLSGVEYISSGGISILIRLVHHLREGGGELHLAAPKPFVRKVFDIVSFDSILRIHEDVESATQEISN